MGIDNNPNFRRNFVFLLLITGEGIGPNRELSPVSDTVEKSPVIPAFVYENLREVVLFAHTCVVTQNHTICNKANLIKWSHLR